MRRHFGSFISRGFPSSTLSSDSHRRFEISTPTIAMIFISIILENTLVFYLRRKRDKFYFNVIFLSRRYPIIFRTVIRKLIYRMLSAQKVERTGRHKYLDYVIRTTHVVRSSNYLMTRDFHCAVFFIKLKKFSRVIMYEKKMDITLNLAPKLYFYYILKIS